MSALDRPDAWRLNSTLPPGGPAGDRDMPDIARQGGAPVAGTLDRVGMADIEVPVQILSADGRLHVVPGVAEAYVSLDDPTAKGIHMSRLFLALQEVLEEEVVGFGAIERALRAFLASHRGLSRRAAVSVRFEMMRKRKALVSDHAGWRSYPVTLSGTLDGDRLTLRMATRITYSSTCPCSAALARQLIQERFDVDFGTGGRVDVSAVRAWLGTPEAIRATPHSQRSHADVEVAVADAADAPEPGELIDRVERALRTVVQAAVKREDEQAFALLNGQNLMFCEDAVRRVKAALVADRRLVDWRVRAAHHESLHPHDAVAVAVRGVPGGFTA